MTTTKGRCLCGDIQYEFEGDPMWVAHCHCESCRRHSSSAVATLIGVKLDQFKYLQGNPSAYESSPGVWRYFCGRCGSPMAHTADKAMPGEVHLYLGSLEHPERFAPGAHVNTAELLSWFEIHDELPRFDRIGGEPSRKGPRKK
jgi:hypothetical protein